jgi:transcriptional regulator with XRE-family HTH domain
MKQSTGKQFMKELLSISGLNQQQMAKEIGISQGALCNSINSGNPNLKRLKAIAEVIWKEKKIKIILKIDSIRISYYEWTFTNIMRKTPRRKSYVQTAAIMGISISQEFLQSFTIKKPLGST